MIDKTAIANDLRRLADAVESGKCDIKSTLLINNSIPVTKGGVLVDYALTGATFIYSTLDCLPERSLTEAFRSQPVSYGHL